MQIQNAKFSYLPFSIISMRCTPPPKPMYGFRGVLKVVHFLKVFTLMLFTEFRGENWRFWRLEEWRTDDRTAPLKGGPVVSHFCSGRNASFGSNNVTTYLGRIRLPHLRISKYFTDDSSVNFPDMVFLHFLQKIGKKWRKTLSWKFTDESSIKYLWIRKWGRWIRP